MKGKRICNTAFILFLTKKIGNNVWSYVMRALVTFQSHPIPRIEDGATQVKLEHNKIDLFKEYRRGI